MRRRQGVGHSVGSEGGGGAAAVRRHLAHAVAGLVMSYLVTVAALVVVIVAPAVFGWRPHLAVSGSMRPMFGPGDVVLVAPGQPGRYYEAPAVITYRGSGGTVTHRVADTRMEPDGVSYTTKGDANRTADSTRVEHTQVVGAVRLVVPLVGLPVLWAQRHDWVWLILWLASIVMALSLLNPERRLTCWPPVPRRQAARATP